MLKPLPEEPQAPRANATADDDLRDLGFGTRVSNESQARLLNPDGTFNVRRTGLSFLQSLHLYHSLLTMSWPRFHALVVTAYFAVNVAFALGYLACGAGALEGATGADPASRFAEAFFFSVQTIGTIGYGRISPGGLAANLLMTIESLLGLLGLALATGILFARFSRPNIRIRFSRSAVIAPYHGRTAFEFRIANERRNELIDVHATVLLSRLEAGPGRRVRRFQPLPLERDRVMFFPLHWVVVHPITEDSPLAGASAEDLAAAEAELLILVTATDETFSQVVHTRSSYKPHQIQWGARFADMFQAQQEGVLTVDLARLDVVERAPFEDA
jgi:inward rectifier potassium channel